MKLSHIPTIDLEVAYPKFMMVVSLSWATSSEFFNKYIFSDWEFLPFIIVLIALDTLTGVWKSVKRHDFSSYSFGGFMTKVILYAVFLAVIHNLTNFSQKETVVAMFSWVQQLCYAALVVREAVSIIENIGVIAPKLLPKWILKRLRQFDENGEFINPNNQ